MIAQINCADLPPNSIYPAEGLLQFWISPIETDTEDYTSSQYDRVIYYPKLGKANRKAHKLVITEDNGFIWPLLGGEYALSFEPENLEPGLKLKQYSTGQLFTRLWNERYPQEQIESPWDLDELAGLEAMTLRAPFMKILITTSWAVFPSISTGTPVKTRKNGKTTRLICSLLSLHMKLTP